MTHHCKRNYAISILLGNVQRNIIYKCGHDSMHENIFAKSHCHRRALLNHSQGHLHYFSI